MRNYNTLMTHDFDVALSFADEDREFVASVAEILNSNKLRVFYDRNEEVYLWGKDLIETLDDVYQNRARFVVMFISRHYSEKMWTRHERRSAFARALREKHEYILPARFDNTPLAGLPPTLSYLDLTRETPVSFARKLLAKVASLSSLVTDMNLPAGEVRALTGHNDAITSLMFSNDSSRALSASLDATMRLWDLATGNEVQRFSGHTGSIHCIDWSSDGRLAVTGGGSDISMRPKGILGKIIIEIAADKTRREDYSIRFWDAQRGIQLHRFPADLPHTYVRHISLHPGGSHVLIANPFICEALDLRTGLATFSLSNDDLDGNQWIADAAFSCEGNILIRAERFVYTFSLQGGSPIRQLRTPLKCWYSFAPGGKYLLRTDDDATYNVFDLLTGELNRSYRKLPFTTNAVANATASRAFAQVGDGYCAIDLLAGAVLFRQHEEYDFTHYALAISPDGEYALSGTSDGRIRLWRLPSATS